MGFTATGISTTTVTTDQQAPLGFELTVPTANNGLQTWVYIFNDDAAAVTFVAGAVVYRDPSAATYDWYGATVTPVTVHQPKVMCIGVAQHSIAAGSYGFVLTQGVGLILSGSAGATVDEPFCTGGDEVGSVITYADDASAFSANIGVIGHAGTAIGADTTGTAYISCG